MAWLGYLQQNPMAAALVWPALTAVLSLGRDALVSRFPRVGPALMAAGLDATSVVRALRGGK